MLCCTTTYEAVRYVLEKICYDQHEWDICVDLKMVNLLLGQQSGFTKYPCFMCMWDRRDLAHMKVNLHLWEELLPCRTRNIINNPVDRDRMLFPQLHIKQFTKALDSDSGCSTYVCHVFQN